jgi:hypothetical protein
VNVWELLARVRVDTAGLTSGLASASARLNTFGQSATKHGMMLSTRLTLPILGVAGAAVKFASDAEETKNRVDVIFGDMASAIVDWSNTAIDKIGAANFTAQNLASEFGLLFQSAGITGKGLQAMSIDFAQLAGDAASFFNVPLEDALLRIRSGLVGEAEPMRKFGVFLTEAATAAEAVALGLAKEGEELSEQTKLMARASLITKGMSSAQGDFARTSGSMANQTRQTIERLKELAASIGRDLMPIAQEVVRVVQGWIEKFQGLDPSTRQVIYRVAALAAAIGPLLLVVGGLSRGLGGLLRIGGGLIGFLIRLGGGASATAASGLGRVAASGAAARTSLGGLTGLLRGGLIAASLLAIGQAAFNIWNRGQKAANAIERLQDAMDGMRGKGIPAKNTVAEFGSEMRSFEEDVKSLQKEVVKLEGSLLDREDFVGPIDMLEVFGNGIADVIPFMDSAGEALEKMRTAGNKAAQDFGNNLIKTLGLIPGGLSETRANMIRAAVAAGDYAGALEILLMAKNEFLNGLKREHRGMKELTTEFDRNSQTTKTWARNQREGERATKAAASANARLGADVRRLGDYVTKLPRQKEIDIDADVNPARSSIESFLRQVTQRTYTLTFTANREGGGWPPNFAGGVRNFGGGAAIVGEHGPELTLLPRGSDVVPAGHFQFLQGSPPVVGGSTTVVVSVDARGSVITRDQDLDRLAERLAEPLRTQFSDVQGRTVKPLFGSPI